MSARRRARHSPLVTIRLAALFVAAVPAAATAQTSSMQALMIGSSWSGWMNQAAVLQAPLPTGGMGAQITVQTNYLALPLLDLVAASVAGKSVATSMQFATYTATAQPVSLLKIGSARIEEVDLPAANSTAVPILVGVRFAQTPFEAGKPTTYPPANPLGQAIRSNYFHLQFDSLDAPTASSVGSMVVRLPDVLKGVNLPQLVVTYLSSATNPTSQAFVTGLQKWFQSQTTRNGTLTFFASDFKTPLLVVRYRGLRVTSVNTPSTGPSTATFAMTGISVQGAAMP